MRIKEDTVLLTKSYLQAELNKAYAQGYKQACWKHAQLGEDGYWYLNDTRLTNILETTPQGKFNTDVVIGKMSW